MGSLGFFIYNVMLFKQKPFNLFYSSLDTTCGIISGEREVSSTMFGKWNVHIPKKKKETESILHHLQKNSLKWIEDFSLQLDLSHKTSRRKQGKKLHQLGLDNFFLDMSPKAQATKAKIRKWDYI